MMCRKNGRELNSNSTFSSKRRGLFRYQQVSIIIIHQHYSNISSRSFTQIIKTTLRFLRLPLFISIPLLNSNQLSQTPPHRTKLGEQDHLCYFRYCFTVARTSVSISLHAQFLKLLCSFQFFNEREQVWWTIHYYDWETAF